MLANRLFRTVRGEVGLFSIIVVISTTLAVGRDFERLFYNSYYVNIAWEGKFFGYGFWVGREKRVTEFTKELAFRSVGKNHAQKLPLCGWCAVG
jgi:hypothetical protein